MREGGGMKLKRIYIEENSFEFANVAYDMPPPKDGSPPDPCVLPGCGNTEFEIREGVAQWSKYLDDVKLGTKKLCHAVCCTQCSTIHAISPLVGNKYDWAAPYVVVA